LTFDVCGDPIEAFIDPEKDVFEFGLGEGCRSESVNFYPAEAAGLCQDCGFLPAAEINTDLPRPIHPAVFTIA
jgi:hypothetical protein